MLIDPFKNDEVQGIPPSLRSEWEQFTSNISQDEQDIIKSWIRERFEEVSERRERVQPSGWLGSNYDWREHNLMPIYRECKNLMPNHDEEEIQSKAGQIFGLFVSLTLSEWEGVEWKFVKGDQYKAHGVPIRSRIYFLPDDQ